MVDFLCVRKHHCHACRFSATTNGPSSFRKLSTSDSAAFCSLDLFSSLGMSDILSAQAGAELKLWLIALHEQCWGCCDVDRARIRLAKPPALAKILSSRSCVATRVPSAGS